MVVVREKREKIDLFLARKISEILIFRSVLKKIMHIGVFSGSHCTVYSVQCTVYIPQFTLFLGFFFKTFFFLFFKNPGLGLKDNTKCHKHHRPISSQSSTVYSAQCTVYRIQCTGYSVHFFCRISRIFGYPWFVWKNNK